ncbi:MAG: hypothetical protein ACRYGH_09665 [Janthinobacterium lividum]
MPTGSNDVGRITSSTRVIAVNTPHNNSLSLAWGGYRTSVDAIEAAAGLGLLSALPPSVQNTLEVRTDMGPTNQHLVYTRACPGGSHCHQCLAERMS